MYRTVKVTINGEERELLYSVDVMFDAADRYENVQNLLELLTRDSRDSVAAVRWCAVRMENEAELCRRESGYEARPMLQETDISLRMHPLEYTELRDAAIQAITLGYRREIVDENEEIDVGLQELNAKKAEAGS